MGVRERAATAVRSGGGRHLDSGGGGGGSAPAAARARGTRGGTPRGERNSVGVGTRPRGVHGWWSGMKEGEGGTGLEQWGAVHRAVDGIWGGEMGGDHRGVPEEVRGFIARLREESALGVFPAFPPAPAVLNLVDGAPEEAQMRAVWDRAVQHLRQAAAGAAESRLERAEQAQVGVLALWRAYAELPLTVGGKVLGQRRAARASAEDTEGAREGRPVGVDTPAANGGGAALARQASAGARAQRNAHVNAGAEEEDVLEDLGHEGDEAWQQGLPVGVDAPLDVAEAGPQPAGWFTGGRKGRKLVQRAWEKRGTAGRLLRDVSEIHFELTKEVPWGGSGSHPSAPRSARGGSGRLPSSSSA